MDEERETRDEQEERKEADLRPDGQDPHHALNNPVGEPDPTEWPDPYETREDPLEPGDDSHAPTGGTSTSDPHPSQDPAVGEEREPPERDKLD